MNPAHRFDALFRTHHAALRRLGRQLGLDSGSADDAAQGAFLVALRRLDEIDHGSERAFLREATARIATHLQRQAVGRAAKHERAWAFDPSEVQPAIGLEELLDRKRAAEALHAIVAEMDADLAMVLRLSELEGRGKTEIARMLGIPEGTAASRVRRARQEMSARFRRRHARSARTIS